MAVYISLFAVMWKYAPADEEEEEEDENDCCSLLSVPSVTNTPSQGPSLDGMNLCVYSLVEYCVAHCCSLATICLFYCFDVVSKYFILFLSAL